ncbi:hypothetical protein JYT72_00030 [Crocinitomix catalasitica]|nr:hypothetical protein [Crocinitomix catalasitica]
MIRLILLILLSLQLQKTSYSQNGIFIDAHVDAKYWRTEYLVVASSPTFDLSWSTERIPSFGLSVGFSYQNKAVALGVSYRTAFFGGNGIGQPMLESDLTFNLLWFNKNWRNLRLHIGPSLDYRLMQYIIYRYQMIGAGIKVGFRNINLTIAKDVVYPILPYNSNCETLCNMTMWNFELGYSFPIIKFKKEKIPEKEE